MRALVKDAAGPGGLRLVDRPLPVPGRGQARLAVGAVGLCGTDVHIVHGAWPVPIPIVPGHEIAGTVDAVGPGVRNVRVGDLVTTETDAFVCRRCRYCRRGDRHLCPRRVAIGTTSDGGLADALVVPAGGLHRLPAGIDPVEGALCEPLAVAVHAVAERGSVGPGDRVAVVGPGTIGLLAAQVARALGADVAVAGLGRHADRLALARRLGIRRTLVLDTGAPPEGTFDVAVECSGAAAAFAAAVRLVARGGTIVQVGFAGRPSVEIDLDAVVNRELTIAASRGKRPSSFASAVGLLAAGRVRLGPLVTDRVPLERWDEAFAIAEHPGRKVVVVITPDGAALA